MTNILIIQGHPDTSQTHLCHAIAENYRNAAELNGHQVQQILIAHETIPFLHSKAEWESDHLPAVAQKGQAEISKAEHIVLIYPLWMGDMPAMLKAWLEQVLRKGFAFEMDRTRSKPALRGKTARVIVTMGMPGLIYRWFFLAHSLRSLDRNILKFCGIRPVRWTIFGNAEDPSGQKQQTYLEQATRLGGSAL